MTTRWSFYDPEAAETWTVPLNPNTMTSPYPKKTQNSTPVSPVDGAIRAIETNQGVEWSFGGVMRTQDHYDTMLTWSQKQNEIEITDHLGRTITVLIIKFDPTDIRSRRPTKWNYTVTCHVIDVAGA